MDGYVHGMWIWVGVFTFNNSFTKWSGVIGVTGVLLGFSLLLIFKHDGLLQTKHTGNGSCRRYRQ